MGRFRCISLAAIVLSLIVMTLPGCTTAATPTPESFTLTTSISPNAGGNVNPSGGTYKKGALVTLIPTAAQYYKFVGWGGDASGNSNPLTVTMDSNKTVVASFAKPTLNTQVDPSGGGTVSPSGGSIDGGAQIAITATANPGFRFDHWTGDASGTINPIKLVVDGDKTVTAHFIKTYALIVSVSPTTGGTVSPQSGTYDAGSVPITATAAFPYVFTSWTGADSGNTNPGTVTLKSDSTVTAHFTASPGPGPTVHKAGSVNTNSASIPIDLRQGEWVAGQVYKGPLGTIADIQDPTGRVIKDFGTFSGSSDFAIQAQVTGKYAVVFSGMGGYSSNYDLTYAIYALP